MKSLLPGDLVLERYRVIEPLPGSDMSTLLAYDDHLGRAVDLVIAPAPSGTPLGILFAWRAQVVGTLLHPALPVVCDVSMLGGYPLFVQRHVDGRPLSLLLEGERSDRARIEAIRLIAAASDAMELAHGRGVCHGWLNADSILVDGHGNAVIADLIWPSGSSATIAQALPNTDVAALGRLLARAVKAPHESELSEFRLQVESVLRRAHSLESGAGFATEGEVRQAVIRLVTRLEAGTHNTAAGAVAARAASSTWQSRTAGVGRTARHTPMPSRGSTHPRARGGGGRHPWAVALLVGAALTLLPGVESVAQHMIGPAHFMHFGRHSPDWGPSPWDRGSFGGPPWDDDDAPRP